MPRAYLRHVQAGSTAKVNTYRPHSIFAKTNTSWLAEPVSLPRK